MRASAHLAGLLFAAAPLLCAAQTRVVSTQPDSVSITIYRDFFALITETRTVDLPAEAVTLEFDGVVETLIPQSAVIADTGRVVAESNYDFDRLSPANLLRKSIGKSVFLTRTNRATGKASQVAATILAANGDGVTFRTADGNEALHCSGLPEKLTFTEIPEGLKRKPTLSIHLAAGTAGKRQVRVSYIAQGFGWAADYVANVNAASDRIDLRGWLTLRNFTDARFENAQVQVVAGRLNLLDAEEGGGTSTLGDSENFHDDDQLASARQDRLEELKDDQELDDRWRQRSDYLFGCYPHGPPVFRREAMGVVDSISAQDVSSGEELEEIVVTGFRASLTERENLADYQMYRLPWKTDLGARQTKQVAFLHKPEVTVDRFYGVRLAESGDNADDIDDFMKLYVRIGWRNRKEDGLGEPLPGGIVRVFDLNGENSVFAGEDSIEDTPVDVPSELSIGRSPDLLLTMHGEEPSLSLLSIVTRRFKLPVELSITNAKSRPVTVEIRQGPMSEGGDLRVVGASQRPTRKGGDYAWRFTVPANGEERLSYKLSLRASEYD